MIENNLRNFGIWAHWGPQCQPESGDWYARSMYEEGGRAYKAHLEKSHCKSVDINGNKAIELRYNRAIELT